MSTSEASNTVLKLREAFSSARAPLQITQDPYDGGPKHLRRLARLTAGDRAEASDLFLYAQSALYGSNLQTQLLAYVLPFCLEAWREDLLGTNGGYGGFVEHLYPLLANKRVFDLHLDPRQSAAVADFMRETILDEIDAQRGLTYRGSGARPYRWVTALTTYGVLLPDVEVLWNRWWSLDTVGKATAAVQYISCLMYPENENPVFAPWTPNEGGGPPSLWEFGGHLYSHKWLPTNVAFLMRALTPQGVAEVLTRAVSKLADDEAAPTALGIQEDIPFCMDILKSRCGELPRILETRDDKARPLPEWTT
ncbi:MAG: hypothetical protein WBM24_09680 [Candidatus Sulfotelmatobacter sp.]